MHCVSFVIFCDNLDFLDKHEAIEKIAHLIIIKYFLNQSSVVEEILAVRVGPS